IFLYQDANTLINRPYLIVDWGDMTTDTCNAGTSVAITPNVLKTTYSMPVHSFPHSGGYDVNVADTFLVPNIENVASINNYLYIHTYYVVSPTLSNNTPYFINDQTVITNSNGTYYHSASAVDSNGDSLAYYLQYPWGVSGYVPPNATIDPYTGLVTFFPYSTGLYLIPIGVEEYRDTGTGVQLISITEREMIIEVNSLASVSENDFVPHTLTVFPNPAKTSATFQLSGQIQMFELIITDQLGREVWRGNSDSDRLQLSTENFLPGMYFCRIEEQGEITASGKLIIE
ncbi:MAG TPA: T9SS type A sorting domain-containing protein, partial [Bacteroidia bacterium]|nr:T9SS type A sorting domain-containing protein [Bacteroidia bacterium]